MSNYCVIVLLVKKFILLFQEDVDIMKKLNFDAYRFSISWSRIFPGNLLVSFMYEDSHVLLCNELHLEKDNEVILFFFSSI